MATYRNPWHKPGQPHYGPEQYATDATPMQHAGCVLYERIPGPVGRCVWDVVRDGVCLTQRAGKRGAMAAAEAA